VDRPRIAKGVRISFDLSRKVWVALQPEGVVLLNPTAEAILRLCDGKRDASAIASELSARFAAPIQK
jgi:pyrroloquinoline quinone biosynthesis protein D